jgi:Domain of unknown function (DUF4186)
MPEETSAKKKLKPLNITCTSTDCDRNLHCFRMTKKLLATGPSGRCRKCGVQLVDWSRVHKRDLKDVRYTFEALRLELIRHHFWHIPLTQRAVNHARRKGRILLRAATVNQLRQLVGSEKHPREGIQTPRETSPHANAIHFAQHATASCCRRCLAEWHGIPEGRALSEDEIAYLTALANMYLEERLPDLRDEPVAVPAVRKQPASQKKPRLAGALEHQNAS